MDVSGTASSPVIVAVLLSLNLLVAIAAAGPMVPQAKPPEAPTVHDGVYTAAQAERGRLAAEHHCTECHGLDLEGGEGAALVGDPFLQKWANGDLGRLYRRIEETMPRGRVDSVTEPEKLDIVAFLLQQNGFPSGDTDLPGNADALARVRIPPREGPLQAGAVVRAIGCLADRGSGRWVLTGATRPELARMDQAPAADRDLLRQLPPGTETVALLNVFPSPTGSIGQRIEARGLLIKNADGDAINVLSIAPIGASCSP